MNPSKPARRDNLSDIERYFGPGWRWSEMALWIEARSRANPKLPDYLIVWAYDFLRIWRRQQEMMREDQPGDMGRSDPSTTPVLTNKPALVSSTKRAGLGKRSSGA